jgi:hypothetical protein
MSTKVIVVVAAFALATALTSPAPAQAGSRSQAYDRPAGAYAQVKRTHRVHRSQSVYDVRGHYRGADPDPFIRDQLKRCRQC